MQIEIFQPLDTAAIPKVQWNGDELKKELAEKLKAYEGITYTEETLSQAKADRAALNKLAAAIDDRRKEITAMYMQPVDEFVSDTKELAKMVKARSDEISVQIDAFDEKRRGEKQAKILAFYESVIGNLVNVVPYERLHNARWLNVTYKMATIEEEIADAVQRIQKDLSTIDLLELDADIATAVKSVYLKDYDLASAIREKDRIVEQRKALKQIQEEASAKKAQQESQPAAADVAQDVTKAAEADKYTTEEENLVTVDFRVCATRKQLSLLKAFLFDNGIKFGKVPTDAEGRGDNGAS